MEIKLNDLRIGNYIFDDEGRICKVECIQSHIYHLLMMADDGPVSFSKDDSDNFYTCQHVYGIPLTEELLLKMGFEDFDVIYSKSPDLVISKDLEWVGIYNIHLEDDIHYDCPKYIHQLQNLYFILSGNELILQ